MSAYSVYLSNGQLLVDLVPMKYDTTTTSLILQGELITPYGQVYPSGLVHLMEHFCNTTPPAQPLTGQLWYNSASNAFQVYNGSQWTGLAGANNTYVYRRFFPGSFTGGQVIDYGFVGEAATFASGFINSAVGCVTFGSGDFSAAIAVNGTTKTTVTIPSGTTTGTFAPTVGFSIGPTDLWTVTVNSPSTLVGLAITMIGQRD